jgi:hypothetical protein
MSRHTTSLLDGDADENPRRIGHHQDHESAIADGSLVPFEEFDFESLEAISELPQSDASRLAEALHGVLLWLVDRRLLDIKRDQNANVQATVARSLKASGLKITILAMCLAPELIGPTRLREVARLAQTDEANLRRLVCQIESRFGISNLRLHR